MGSLFKPPKFTPPPQVDTTNRLLDERDRRAEASEKKEIRKLAADELNLHRLHVTVSAQNVRAVKWIEHIYFKREGVLKKYSFNKKDMIMYSRLF